MPYTKLIIYRMRFIMLDNDLYDTVLSLLVLRLHQDIWNLPLILYFTIIIHSNSSYTICMMFPNKMLY